MQHYQKDVINYAIIRFLPYHDVSEFVNVGIIAYSPITGLLHHKLECRKYSRITKFFPELKGSTYLNWARAYTKQLQNLEKSFEPDALSFLKEEQQNIFKQILDPQEGLFHYSPLTTVMCDNAEQKVNDLFTYYILRAYADKKDTTETTLTNSLKNELKRLSLLQRFRTDQIIGDDEYHITIPFYDGKHSQAIKPFDLNKKDAVSIYEHGDRWVNRIKRLRRNNTLPKRMLFTVNEAKKDKLKLACDEIITELKRTDVEVISLANNDVNKITHVDMSRISNFIKVG